MRYRLSTLLIIITLVGLLCGWVAHLRHTAAFHRREVVRLAARIAEAKGIAPDEVQGGIAAFASRHSDTQISRTATRERQITLRTNASLLASQSTLIDEQAKAMYHTMMAERYDEALYRPWILFLEKAPVVDIKAIYVPAQDPKRSWGGGRPDNGHGVVLPFD